MARVDSDAAAPTLRVRVACTPRAGLAVEVGVELASPATASDALRSSGLLERHPELSVAEPNLGIWGRACSPDALLHDGDRVELYRPLALDPQEARRLRAGKARAAARR